MDNKFVTITIKCSVTDIDRQFARLRQALDSYAAGEPLDKALTRLDGQDGVVAQTTTHDIPPQPKPNVRNYIGQIKMRWSDERQEWVAVRKPRTWLDKLAGVPADYEYEERQQ